MVFLSAIVLTIVTGFAAWMTRPPGPGKTNARPLAEDSFYIDPSLPAAKYARDHPTEDWARRLSQVPRSHWLADQRSTKQLGEWLRAIEPQFVPVLVLFRIPDRGCIATPDMGRSEYSNWIQSVIQTLGKRRAVIIYEPNALTEDCFDRARANIMLESVKKLTRVGHTVYIDASPQRLSLPETRKRLLQVGVNEAQGFSLNVGSYLPTADVMNIGDQLSSELGDRKYIIDTSRNGRGMPADRSSNIWSCNPPTVGAGARPTTDTHNPRVDAFLWVKNPDISDGTCRAGEPAAGEFFPEQAKRVAANAYPPL